MYPKKIITKITLLSILLSSGIFQSHADTDKAIVEQIYEKLPTDVVPELASKGQYSVGVRTVKIINPAQLDVATQVSKDRALTIEVWYPTPNNISVTKATYEDKTRTGIDFALQGNAFRNSDVLIDVSGDVKGKKFPLIVISHGYTGYRTMMYYLGEHLASHGYIVAAIDHTDSTNSEVDIKNAPYSGFLSTLLNRSKDQQFTLSYFTSQTNFVSKAIDTENAGLIGYSMGGYGAVNTIGGCYNFNEVTAATFTGVKDPVQLKKIISLLNSCAGGQYQNINVDAKWKAVLAFAPWGGQHNLFSKEKLATIKTPILYVVGSLDDVSGYDGVKSLYEDTGSVNKYLLTYENARHNIAPHPAPSVARKNIVDFSHYYEPSWSTIQLNNINKHFALAMMDCYIKKYTDKCDYLELSENSNQIAIEGKVPALWKGFDHRYSTGMKWNKK